MVFICSLPEEAITGYPIILCCLNSKGKLHFFLAIAVDFIKIRYKSKNRLPDGQAGKLGVLKAIF